VAESPRWNGKKKEEYGGAPGNAERLNISLETRDDRTSDPDMQSRVMRHKGDSEPGEGEHWGQVTAAAE
jgi:hypothetical protein